MCAGIVVGLLAMDRVPNQGHSYPVGVVNDKKITYAEFDSRIKNIVQNQYQGQHLEDEQYNQLRSEVFRSFVRQILLNEQFEKAELSASVAELESEFSRNPDAVRGRLVQEAQRRLYMIQQQATSQEDLMQRTQAYIAHARRNEDDFSPCKGGSENRQGGIAAGDRGARNGDLEYGAYEA